MIKRENFLGGMSEVLPAENLPEGMAAAIENMRLDRDGTWRVLQEPAYRDDLQFESGKAYAWQPVYMPSGADSGEDTVYVYFASGFCAIWYKTGYDPLGEPYWTMTLANDITDLIETDSVRVGYDSQQFVFVDGRENGGAQRITIDSEGDIHLRRFGTEQPKTKPTILQIDNERYEDEAYTGLPVGSILFYCYCIVNEYGERSNPSPLAICDTAQWLAKGTLELEEDYAYIDINGGSIKSVSVSCAIPQPDEAKRIELYRTGTPYFESAVPLPPLKLVTSQAVPEGADTVNMTDSAFASAIEADYENDSAPAGDDISLESGTVFIANAVTQTSFGYPVDKAWAITLTNRNQENYVNRWICIDIRNSAGNFVGLSNTNAIYEANYRFVYSDMITPITAWGTKANTDGSVHTFTDIVSGDTLYYHNLVWLQVPYIAANSDTTIYLVQYSDNVDETYGSNIQVLTEGNSRTFLDSWIDNPVRDENCKISVGRIVTTPPVTDGWQAARGNKANAFWKATTTGTQIWDNQGTIIQALPIYDYSENSAVSYNNSMPWTYTGGAAAFTYSGVEGMGDADSGYFYIFAKINASYSIDDVKLAAIVFGSDSSIVIALDNAVGGKSLAVKIGDDDDSPYEVYQHPLTGGTHLFAFVSWQRDFNATGADVDQKTLLKVATLEWSAGLPTYTETYHNNAPKLKEVNEPAVYIYENHLDSDIKASGYWCFNMGEFIDNDYEILALSRFDTHFKDYVIGVRNFERTLDTVGNVNVAIEALELENSRKPGKIRWSNGGAVPDLYEHNIFEAAVRIVPLKSFQPTDEHNTLLIWTEKNVLRMGLSGINQEASAVITEARGIGLQNPDCLVQVADGVIWSEKTGIYYLSAGGLKEIGQRRVTLDVYERAIYDPYHREVLFVKSDSTAMVYSLDYDVWSQVDYGVEPQGYLEIDGAGHLLSAEGIYELEPDGDTLTPRILTRKIPARNKINRLTLHSEAGNVKAFIHNHRLAVTPKETATYALGKDDPKGIPQLSGDYVQFEIETDSIHSFDVEDRNG